MSFDSITNRGEFFSNHYLDAILGNDLGDLRKQWDEAEAVGQPTARSGLRSLPDQFFRARAVATEAGVSRRIDASRALNDLVLAALGFTPDPKRSEQKLARSGDTDTLTVAPAACVETHTGLLLVALDAHLAADVDELFSSDDATDPVELCNPLWREGDKKSLPLAPDAINGLFSLDDPPRFVLVMAGRIVLLAERAKWAEGRFLAVDLDAALERGDTKAKGELETIAALFSADALVPGSLGDEGGQSFLDELVDNSHKHAVGVSKELRHGIRESIEILANEVIDQRLASRQAVYEGPNAIDARDLTNQCLRWLYRLLVLLYAESRPELGILPTDDDAYLAGYSLDRLRELTLVDLDTDRAQDGSHLNESLQQLFDLVNGGYHEEHAQQQLAILDASEQDSRELYLQFPGLDAALFDKTATPLLDGVTLRNEPLQRVLGLLMLTPEGKGKGRNADRGFISYAQLGINQLGAVYEGLMAYTGFFADQDLYEVAKHGDPSDGTWVLPVDQADDYPDDVFVTRTDETTGRPERVLHRRGSFVFRLSGRDRQRSASYYTPEVLTRCVVKHALAELLGMDDYAPENGSSGITEATEILDLTICEPALGSGAFLNEAINQLSAEYLRRRQLELGETLDAEQYRRELQKVKAHFALHQSYGVDLNATAVELAEVSLWLNCMHPGLKAPWFGLQLRDGNSLIGCRRATWRADQLGDRPWAKIKKGEVQPPVDRKLSNGPLADEEIHHFLLPGHGWAAVADRKEARGLRPDQAKALKEWRKQILAAPKKSDAARLQQLARAVEDLWARATERIRLTQQALRRPIDVYGATVADRPPTVSRAEAERILGDPDSPLGRLRTLMDAWTGLWFWPVDTDARPPSWSDWLTVAEELAGVDERHGPTGQLGFDDLEALLAAESRDAHRRPVTELVDQNRWLEVAVTAARREGAWHWDLEFASVYQSRGGFDLQVGNPPWVRLDWKEDLTLAEADPWWGITEKAPTKEQKARRELNLSSATVQSAYLVELASAEGVVETVGSPVLRPVLTGIRTNLYMVFMDTVWNHLSPTGTAGLLHPESHFTDPKGEALRRATYGHLRRHWQFVNELFLFEDIHNMNVFGVHVYGALEPCSFRQASYLFHPDVIESSIGHDGAGELPGIQYQSGGWDLRPHRARVLTITEGVLTDWARLFDEPGTPAAEARLLRPITTADLDALSVLADQPTRLADRDYHWTQGWNETNAKEDGTIRWETTIPASWDEVILQGPHFTIATPFNKQPNENCKNNRDYSEWDLETLPEHVIPRTNYQRACDPDTYTARLDHWNGRPYTDFWRLIWRRMTQPGLERSTHATIIPPGPGFVFTTWGISLPAGELAAFEGLMASIPVDYLTKVSGRADITFDFIAKFPFPSHSRFTRALVLRSLRLNCLTADYAPLWEELYDSAWQQDRWADPEFHRLTLADIGPEWTMATPLRRDFERRLALVELDALAALMLGLTAEQLCAMYRTQFAVLRKYEHRMVFDAEGRKICGYHQSAGYRQAELQDQAKDGDLPPEWKNLWKLYEQYEADPSTVDWLGHYAAPFTRPDREKEMTRAYEEFQRRLERST